MLLMSEIPLYRVYTYVGRAPLYAADHADPQCFLRILVYSVIYDSG